MLFAVFIEPEGLFKLKILEWKNKVGKYLPDQKYNSHPPHCTIICTKVDNYSEAAVYPVLIFNSRASEHTKKNQQPPPFLHFIIVGCL